MNKFLLSTLALAVSVGVYGCNSDNSVGQELEGKVFRSGTAEELANDPMVRKVYLGTNFSLR